MWRCAKCGEASDDGFDACWQCGTARAGEATERIAVAMSDTESPYRSPQNQDPPVVPVDVPSEARPGSDRLTRQEIGTLACRIIALWFLAYGLQQLLVAVFGVAGTFFTRSRYGEAGGYLIYLLIPLSYFIAGCLIWFNALWLGEAIGGRDTAPIASVDWNPQQLLTVALAACGVFLLMFRLQELVQQIAAAAAQRAGVIALFDSTEQRVVSFPILIGIGLSLGLIFGCRKLAAFVYRPRSSVDDSEEGERTD